MEADDPTLRRRRGIALVLLALTASGLAAQLADPIPITRPVDCSGAVRVGPRLWCDGAPKVAEHLCRRLGLWSVEPTQAIHAGDEVDPVRLCLLGHAPGRMEAAGLAALELPVNVNVASASELASLPGVGPVTARHIVRGRPFTSLEDLLRVRGIGPKRLAALRPRARLTWN